MKLIIKIICLLLLINSLFNISFAAESNTKKLSQLDTFIGIRESYTDNVNSTSSSFKRDDFITRFYGGLVATNWFSPSVKATYGYEIRIHRYQKSLGQDGMSSIFHWQTRIRPEQKLTFNINNDLYFSNAIGGIEQDSTFNNYIKNLFTFRIRHFIVPETEMSLSYQLLYKNFIHNTAEEFRSNRLSISLARRFTHSARYNIRCEVQWYRGNFDPLETVSYQSIENKRYILSANLEETFFHRIMGQLEYRYEYDITGQNKYTIGIPTEAEEVVLDEDTDFNYRKHRIMALVLTRVLPHTSLSVWFVYHYKTFSRWYILNYGKSREDNFYQLTFNLTKNFQRKNLPNITLKYTYTENDSDEPQESYRKNTISLNWGVHF